MDNLFETSGWDPRINPWLWHPAEAPTASSSYLGSISSPASLCGRSHEPGSPPLIPAHLPSPPKLGQLLRQEAPSVFLELKKKKSFLNDKNVSKSKDLNYFAIKEAYFQTSRWREPGCCVGCVKGLLKKGTQLSKIWKPVLLQNIYRHPSPLNIFPSSSLD